jgi:Hg(II)-responsive transcriptional regulator
VSAATLAGKGLDSVPWYRVQIWITQEVRLRTSEIANAAGVNIQTLRYYERRGLLPVPERRASGYRDYDASIVQRIDFIRRARELGFTLAEIAELLELRDGAARARRGARPEVRALVTSKLATIEAKLQHLRAMSAALAGLLESCDGGSGTVECPIIEALQDGSATTGTTT